MDGGAPLFEFATEEDALASPFVRALVRLQRAHDAVGAWERLADAAVLAEFLVSATERRARPILGNADAAVVRRVEMFHRAIALALGEATGTMPVVVISLSPEGFGQALVIAGRLVAVQRPVRDGHRFGFPSLTALAAEGAKRLADAMALVARYPEVAQL